MNDDMLPLCGALSAEMSALPKSIQKRVRRFFEIHIAWLEGVVRDGVAAKDLRQGVDTKRAATLILSTLEGASLVAWAIKDANLVDPTIGQAIASLEA
jgi:TetR/AcrR family transcriptional repressor of nem operon